jgi:hypothetical protein
MPAGNPVHVLKLADREFQQLTEKPPALAPARKGRVRSPVAAIIRRALQPPLQKAYDESAERWDASGLHTWWWWYSFFGH